MSVTEEEVAAWLIKGSLHDHTRLYLTDATFHHQIDCVVSLLPAMVDVMAANAEQAAMVRQQHMQALMNDRPWPTPD